MKMTKMKKKKTANVGEEGKQPGLSYRWDCKWYTYFENLFLVSTKAEHAPGSMSQQFYSEVYTQQK